MFLQMFEFQDVGCRGVLGSAGHIKRLLVSASHNVVPMQCHSSSWRPQARLHGCALGLGRLGCMGAP